MFPHTWCPLQVLELVFENVINYEQIEASLASRRSLCYACSMKLSTYAKQ